jgi:phosphohistidine phosphatase
MNLLVVRHAIAADPAEYAREHPDDAGRPLTPEGLKKMKRVARGLRSLVPDVDLLATSPYTRARETADILAAVYKPVTPVVVPVLAPGQPAADVGRWLEGARRHDTVAIVGHEPGLSRIVSWLLAGGERSFVELKKSAACLLAIPDTIGAGCATLRWALTPGQLRDLGGSPRR